MQYVWIICETKNTDAKWTGVDVRNRQFADMFKEDVLEPVVVQCK